jgi:hypothetical protein
MTQFARHAVHGVERIDKKHWSTDHHQYETDAEFDARKPQHRKQDP